MLFKAFGRFRESADQQPSHFAGNCVFASQSTGPRVGEGNQSRYDETETTKNRFRNPNNACSAILVICRIPGSSRGAQNHVFPKENLVFMHFIGFAEVGNTILTHTYASKCISPGPGPTHLALDFGTVMMYVSAFLVIPRIPGSSRGAQNNVFLRKTWCSCMSSVSQKWEIPF